MAVSAGWYGNTASPHAVETGNEAFASEADARKSGRRALIRASACVPVGRRRAVTNAAIDGTPVG